MTTTEFAIFVAIAGIIATLVSPCLAVQAQKWLEELREKKRRKMIIFATLMTTRASRTAPDHVMALNAIDLTFIGNSAKEKAVVAAWQIYFDHLHQFPAETEEPETFKMKMQVWGEKGEDLFVALLKSLSDALGFNFSEVQLKRGIYYPRAHGEKDAFDFLLRNALTNVISGKASIPMNVTGFPFSQEAVDLQQKLNNAVLGAISDGSLQVFIKPSKDQKE
jgi:hypothetical protein